MSIHLPVAVTGMHGRLPAAQDLREFWDNLEQGKDAIQAIPGERWRWQDYADETDSEYSYSRQAGITPGVDCFDHRFFGILPKEAQSMDPQQRLFLQTVWNALEDAGYAPSSLAGRKVGVFVGVGHADYPGLMRQAGVASDAWRGTGIALTAIANRVSFLLDFHGPSESIDTACSGSLVAVHRATRALQEGECDLAIVGGVNLLLGPELFIAFSRAGMLSPSHRCHTFSAEANGYVRGEGVGALVLTPLASAQQRGDFIYGVIRGSAENHGGRAHSFTAPNAKAQAEVIHQAWKNAGLSLHQASLIETHGTGTPLGDPIEINALKRALEKSRDRATDDPPSIRLGALKSHIGHLEAAAGIASLIKTLLSMQYQRIPGNLHHQALNPEISLGDSALEIATSSNDWGGNQARYAGVSSFGFGGVNAHVVLESAPFPDASESDAQQTERLILLSAKDKDGLNGRARQLLALLQEQAGVSADHYLVARLRQALNLSAGCEHTPLIRIDRPPQQILAAAQDAGFDQITEVALAGCLTLNHFAEHLQQIDPARSARESKSTTQRLLSCRTALSHSVTGRHSLDQLALTLMEGRDAMPERLAMVCCNLHDLQAQLDGFLAQSQRATEPGQPSSDSWYHGNVKRSKKNKTRVETLSLHQEAQAWVSHKQWPLEWQRLYPGAKRPLRLPLPGYPFSLKRVWFESKTQISNPRLRAVMDTPSSRKTSPSHHNPALQQKTTSMVPEKDAGNRHQADWQQYWLGPAPANSLQTLAVLLSQPQPQRQGLQLADVTLGRPDDYPAPDNWQYQFGQQGGQHWLQVVCAQQHVLLQARLASYHDTPEPVDGAQIQPNQQRLHGQELDEALTNLPFSSLARHVKHVLITDQQLELVLNQELDLSRDDELHQSAASLFTALLLASIALWHRHRSGTENGRSEPAPLLVPARIQRLQRQPGAGLFQSLRVTATGQNDQLDLRVYDGSRQSWLYLGGIQTRQLTVETFTELRTGT